MSAGKSEFQIALDELGVVLGKMDEKAVDAAYDRLAKANLTGVYGCGREALQLKGFRHAALPSPPAGLGGW